VKPASPLPTSFPDQLTLKLGQEDEAGRADTWLTGGVLSIVFVHTGVFKGAFASKTTDAKSEIWVPVARPGAGVTLKNTPPLAPGGRKPTRGFRGAEPVAGSIDPRVHVSVCVAIFSFASTLTSKLCVGRRSATVVNSLTPAPGLNEPGGTGTWMEEAPFGRLIPKSVSVLGFTLGTSGWVTTTCWAGTGAVGSLLKEIPYVRD
jgi:hypothetical protein